MDEHTSSVNLEELLEAARDFAEGRTVSFTGLQQRLMVDAWDRLAVLEAAAQELCDAVDRWADSESRIAIDEINPQTNSVIKHRAKIAADKAAALRALLSLEGAE